MGRLLLILLALTPGLLAGYPRGISNNLRQVPCSQVFGDFIAEYGESCKLPCRVICPSGCDTTRDAHVTGSLFHTWNSTICHAALYQGVIDDTGGIFSIRNSGLFSQFIGGDENGIRAGSSDDKQSSWFIEPYERVRFLKEPSDVTLPLGSSLYLTCKTNRRASTSIYWYKDDRQVEWSPDVDCRGEVCAIQSVEKSQSGVWNCKVTSVNSGTLISRHARVTVAYLNRTMVYQPRDLHRAFVDQRQGGTLQKLWSQFIWPLVIPCSIESVPTARIVWYKNQQRFEAKNAFAADDGSLYFLSVDQEDTGSYHCEGYNPSTKDRVTSIAYWLQKDAEAARSGPLDPSWVFTRSNVYANPGDSVTITCIARGNPIPSISWSRTDSKFDDTRTTKDPRKLVINDVRRSDSGEYKCNAMNKYNEDGANHLTSLSVQTPLSFSILPSDVTAKRGEKVTLRCGVAGSASVKWLRDSKQVMRSTRYSLQGNYLVIEDVSVKDVGMYQCTATQLNTQGEFIQNSALLTVETPPKITLDPADMQQWGGDVVIFCNATGFPFPFVTWKFNGRPVNFADKVQMVDVQTIRILNADGIDSGNYTCTAQNMLGQDSLTRYLNVMVKGQVRALDASDDRGYYIAGSQAAITCIVAGTQKLSVEWAFEGTIIDKDSPQYTMKSFVDINLDDFVILRTILQIRSIQSQYSGKYSCKARNYLGGNMLNIRLTVFQIPVLPVLQTGPISTVVSQEKNLMLSCVFTGAPPPRVDWKLNQDSVIEDGRVVVWTSEDGLTSNLRISDASINDSGNYTCEGQNRVGTTKKGSLNVNLFYEKGGLTNSTNSSFSFTFYTLFLHILLIILFM